MLEEQEAKEQSHRQVIREQQIIIEQLMGSIESGDQKIVKL